MMTRTWIRRIIVLATVFALAASGLGLATAGSGSGVGIKSFKIEGANNLQSGDKAEVDGDFIASQNAEIIVYWNTGETSTCIVTLVESPCSGAGNLRTNDLRWKDDMIEGKLDGFHTFTCTADGTVTAQLVGGNSKDAHVPTC